MTLPYIETKIKGVPPHVITCGDIKRVYPIQCLVCDHVMASFTDMCSHARLDLTYTKEI